MKSQTLGLLLACAFVAPPSFSSAGQVEADFNDMFLGNTMTRGNTASPNNLNVNSGKGFQPNDPVSGTGGRGEYNNNTGVVLFEKGDLKLPVGASPGYLSAQRSPVDPLAQTGNTGVVFGSGTNTTGEVFTRMQDRGFASPMTNNVIWFSFLFRADGPNAQGALIFNPDDNADSGSNTGNFLISIGSSATPGAVAINTNPTQTPASLVAGGNPNLIYFDGVGGTADYNANGFVDGVSTGQDGIANIRTHLIIGRITQDTTSGGADVIEVWLDPTNGADPTGQAPTLTYTGDEIPTTGLVAIGFKGTRAFAPSPAGGPYTAGGHFAMDHVRVSDQADALLFVTGNQPVDPKLVIVPGSPGNFNFRGVYGVGSPLVSQPITVTVRNDGAANPIQINTISFQTTNTPTVFNITSAPTLPFSLAPGASTNITVQASSSTFETTFTNTLKIATDHADQDMSLSVAATFYGGGSRINQNPNLDANINGWTSDNFAGDETPPGIVTPGFIGSTGMALMKGASHPGGGMPDNLSQTLLNGAKDWELAFFMSPLDLAQFESRTGAAPAGTDRTFQVIIQSDNLVPVPAYSQFGKWTDLHNGVAAMINLAYLPAQGGFRVFNGSNWVSIGLPAITGSTDTNNDGRLQSGTDTVNSYLVRIKGTGFGTAQAKYTVSVSQPNSTITAATSADLTIFASTSGQTNTPAAYTFTTGDVSSSGGDSVKTSSYWLDEVSFFAVEARDPDISASAQSVVSHNGVTSSGGITVTNTGFSNDLVVSGIEFQFAHVFASPQVFPLTVPKGSSVVIPVNMINGFTTGNNAARGNVTLSTNVTLAPTRVVSLLGSLTTTSNLLGNWNFDVPGGDPAADTDSFAVWEENPNPTNSKDVASPLITGGPGTTCAFLGTNTGIATPLGAPTGEFVMEFDFALKGTADKDFNLLLTAANMARVDLFYRGGAWFVQESESEAQVLEAALSPSTDANNDFDLNDAGDVKAVYKMRFTGIGWNTGTPSYHFEILSDTGVPLFSSETLAIFQGLPNGGANRIEFKTANVTGSGLWVDNVRIATVVESGPLVTNLTGGPGNFTIQWNAGASAVTVERSTTLQAGDWTPVSTGNTTSQFTDNFVPAEGRVFYRLKKE